MWTRASRAPLFALLLAAVPAHAHAADPDLRALLTEILDRPEELPAMKLRALVLGESRAAITLELPSSMPLENLSPVVENRYELAVGALAAHRPDISQIDLLVAHPGGRAIPPPAARSRPTSRPPRIDHVFPDPARYPHGQALRGKTIAISPGHGYIYYDTLQDYSTQRGRVFWEGCGDCRGIVEDFETHEIVTTHLIPLLEGAGARVVLVRERSHEAEAAISDNAGMMYQELGGTFTDGSSPGGWAGGYRASTDPGAAARFTITAPITGPQLLTMWFVAGTNRYPDTIVDVRGAFGANTYFGDFTTHGRRWTAIGVFDLDQGEQLEVSLTAPMGATGAIVPDAVRLGAGKHSTGHSWWEMGAQPFAAYQEAPAEVTAYGDVTIRPRYAEFYGADVYVALHSNASGAMRSTASGISSYRYNCGTFPDHSADPPAADCDDPVGSDRLQALIHAAMVDQIRATWDPNFNDRGPKVANFGELRELDGIPGVLIESAFHDQVILASGSMLKCTDNQSLHDPRWRSAAAWGIYKGVSEFLVGAGPLLAPPPPAVWAKRESATSVLVDFTPVNGALSYRVYVARNGRTFDQGVVVTNPPARIENLSPESVVFARVASLDEAGEGLPSAIVTARASGRRAQILAIDGFEREDAWIQDQDNRHDTLMIHGLAMAARDAAFDSANEAALAAGNVTLDGYDAIVLALGAESTEHGVLTPAIRANIATFAAAGGAVFMSGSELGWALGQRGDMESQGFLDAVFGAAYASDDAAATAIHAASGGWFDGAITGAAAELDDGTKGALRARSSDVLQPQMSGTVELWYEAMGEMNAAAVRRDKSVIAGVALDSLVSPAARAEVIGAWIDRAITLAPIDPQPDGGVPLPDAMPGEDATTQPGADAAITPTPDAGTTMPAEDAGEPTAMIEGSETPSVLAPPFSGYPPGQIELPARGGDCSCRETGRATDSTLIDAMIASFPLALFMLLRTSRRARS